MATILESNLVALEYSRHFVNALLATIPEEQLCHQPFPGANHALWIMGHLASVDAFLLQACGGPADPQLGPLQGVFFMKSQPSPNVGDYPPVAQVRVWFDQVSHQTDFRKRPPQVHPVDARLPLQRQHAAQPFA